MNRSGLPRWMVVVAVLGALLFAAPILGLLLEVPWNELVHVVGSQVVLEALTLSLVASVSAVVVAILLGLPMAMLLARIEGRSAALLRGVVLLPLVLPPVVGGSALLFTFGRRGLIGGPLADATGIVLPFSIWGVIVAVSFIAVPFTVVTVEGALRAADRRLEMAAQSLGAGPSKVLRRVTLPAITPAIWSGLALTWARAFGEFGATIAFAGSLQGRTETLPLAVFVNLVTDRDAAIAISLVMVVVSLIILIAMRDRWVGGGR